MNPDKVYKQEVRRLQRERYCIEASIPIELAVVLISGLQLARQHAHCPEGARENMLLIGQILQEHIGEQSPALAAVLDLGWQAGAGVTEVAIDPKHHPFTTEDN